MLNNSLGFIIVNIQNNDLYSKILKEISLLIENNPYSNVVVFSNNCDNISTHNVPILHLSHSKFFNGDLWLFDIMSVVLTQKFTNYNKKILYTNDIPWIKNRETQYNEWQKIFNEHVDFVSSNQYIYDIYDICWKKPLGIMESFNHEKIQSILQSIN